MPKQPEATQAGRLVRVGECLYRYSSNRVYYAVLKHHGKIFRQSLKTTDRAIANRELNALKKSMAKIDPGAGKLTIGALADRYLNSIAYLDDKTVRTRKSIAKQFKATWPGGVEQPIQGVRASEVQTWLGLHSSRVGKATLNEYLRFVRQMFTLALNDRMVVENPAAGIKQRRLDKPIRETPTWEQFQAIVKDIRAQKLNADAEDSAEFVEFLGLAGQGNSEAANLKVRDVDFTTGKMTLYRNKTDTGFQVPIFPQVRAFLQGLIERRQLKPGDSLFRVRDAKKSLSSACKRLGFSHFSHRAFRRCFITRAIELGVDFKTLAAWQGHKDGGALIAKTYSHLRTEHSDRMAEKMVGEQPKAG